MMRSIIRAAALSLLLASLMVGTVLAQDGGDVSADEVNAVAKQLFCPVCESTPLDVCPTQACEDWRDLIRVQLSEGQSEQQILDYFASQYGNAVLAEPPQSGATLVIWIMPIVFLTAGGVFFARYLRRLRGQDEGDDMLVAIAGEPAGSTSLRATATFDTYVDQIEAELQEL